MIELVGRNLLSHLLFAFKHKQTGGIMPEQIKNYF